MKKVSALLAAIGIFVSASTHAANFKDITFWVGAGTNQAGFEIDWNDGTTNAAYIWGYRWNGDATGEQMFDDIVAADPRLYAEISSDTQFGKALFGFGLDHNADEVFPLNPALTFVTNHLAVSDYNSVDDNRTSVDTGDRWQEGWFSAGFWSYWLSDDSRLSDDFTDWSFSPLGMSSRTLANGDWDGWSFARGFNDSLPMDPFPPGPLTGPQPLHPTFRLVHGFSYSDGNSPSGRLILSGNKLYGSASGGGTNGYGVVFSVQTDGANFTDLHHFAGDAEGRFPLGGLVLSGGMLHGTTSDQGSNGSGTVFAIGTNGSNFKTVRSFAALGGDAATNGDGAFPQCGLTLANGNLIGSGYSGGKFGNGALFRIKPNEYSFKDLHNFSTANLNGFNQDGTHPSIEMIAADGVLYGVSSFGGMAGMGNVFKVHADGSGFTVLHSFTALDGSTNVDGAAPYGKLLLVDGVLYGTTSAGGDFGSGTIFSIGKNGSGFTNLYHFSALSDSSSNGDGDSPVGNLVLDGDTLYGITQYGGLKGQGSIFQINTDGSSFFSLASFPRLSTSGTNSVGANPGGGLVQVGNSFYGTTSGGGPNGNGAVFALDLPNAPLNLSVTNNQMAVSWPIWAPNYTLETSTNFFSKKWTTVTNRIAGTNFWYNGTVKGGQEYFRLRK